MILRLAVAIALATALSACGSSNQPAAEPSGTEAVPTDSAAIAPVATPTAGDASETPPAIESPAPTPTPKASASEAKDDESATGASASPPQAFSQCSVCHSTEAGKTIIGPSLAGVYGSKAGAVTGFQFSTAMKNSGLTWNAASLDKFLADPKAVVPGTLMSFAGLKDEEQREAVIRYLKTLK